MKLCIWCSQPEESHKPFDEEIGGRQCLVDAEIETYGFFHGGDPRDFTPDADECSPEEIANWERDCTKWNETEQTEPEPCPSYWKEIEPGTVAHVLVTPYGIGSYKTTMETIFETKEEPASVDGATLVYEMIDAAIGNAMENGSEAFGEDQS